MSAPNRLAAGIGAGATSAVMYAYEWTHQCGAVFWLHLYACVWAAFAGVAASMDSSDAREQTLPIARLR